MTILDLGVLRAFADIDDAPFQSKYARLLGQLRSLGGSAEKSAAGVSTLDESLATTAASADKAGAALSRVQGATKGAAAAASTAAKATNDQAAAQERVNAVMAQYAGESRQVQAAALRVVATQERLNTLQASGVATTRQLATAQATLITQQRSLARAQELSGVTAGSLASRVSRSGAAMTSVGRSLMRTWGLAGGVIAAVSIKSATDFSTAMRRIQTQAGGSSHDVTVLSQRVLDLAKTAQHGPVELANALYHLKSVGMDNVSAMRALKQGTDLANVSGANLEDTVNALAGAWRTGIQGATSFHQAVATVNAIVGAGNMRVSDLNAALGTGILPTAKTFGLTFKDVGSALALFTDEGMGAEQAATRLRMSISLLGAPSKAAEAQLEKIHLTGLNLANDMRQPNGLITAIGDLKSHLDASGKSASEQAQLLSHAFGGGRSSSAILSMINNYDVLAGKQQQVTDKLHAYDAAVKAQQATPQAQFANLSANLQRAAVILGDDILPTVTSLTKDVTGLVQWFEKLPAPVKSVAGDLATAAIVAGPLLFVLGKFAGVVGATMRLSAGIRGIAVAEKEAATGSYLMGARIRSAFSAISGAVRNPSQAIATMATNTNRLGAALAGVGIGLATGMLTRHASGATKALSDLGAAAGGAAVGFAMGGPLGAAIGGLGAGLSSLATQFIGNGDAAAAAARKQAIFQHQVEGLTQAIQQDNGVVAANTQAYVANALQTSGAAAAAQKLGVNLHDLELAASGNGAAQNRVNAAHERWLGVASRETAATQRIIDKGGVLTASQKRQQNALAGQYALWGKVTSAIGGSNTAIGDAIKRLTMHQALLGRQAAAQRDVTSSTGVATDALRQQATALRDVYRTMTAVQQAELANAQSEDQFLESVRGVTSQLKGNNDTLGTNTARGLANRDAFLNALSAATSYQQAQEKTGTSTRQATLDLADNVQQLIKAAIQAGANKKQVDRLVHSLGLLPRDIRTQITLANRMQIQTDLVGIGQKINEIAGNHIITLTVIDPTSGLPHGNTSRLPGRASGGSVPEGLSWVGEGGAGARPELLAKRGSDVQVVSHPKAVAFAHAAGITIPGFAGGTGNERRIWDYLRGKGLAPDVTAGIMGNLERESGFSPTAANPSGHYGIAQWGGGRWVALNALAAREGKSPWSLGPQLDYLWQELTGPYRSVLTAIESARGARSAAGIFNRQFEVSGDYGGARAGYASDILSQFRGTGGGGGGGTGTGSGGGITVVGHGKNKQWRYGGILYQSLSAAQNAQTRDQQSSAKQVRQQQRQDALSFAKEIRALPAAFDSVKNANAALRPMLRELSHLGIPEAELDRLQRQQDHLDKLIRRDNKQTKDMQAAHAKWRAAFAHMHQEAATFTQAGRSGFDITTAGQDANGKFAGGRLLARQAQYINILRRLYPAFHKIVPIFDKTATGRSMLRQLASEDPTQALAEVLALANSPRLDKQLLHGQAEEARLTGQFGGYLGRQLDLPTVQRDRAQFERDKRLEHRTERAIDHATTRLEKGLARAFDHTMSHAVWDIRYIHGQWRGTRVDEKQHKKHRHVRKSS